MIDDRLARPESALDNSFERYLENKGKGRGGQVGTTDTTRRANSCPNLLPLYLCGVAGASARGYIEAHQAKWASAMAPLPKSMDGSTRPSQLVTHRMAER